MCTRPPAPATSDVPLADSEPVAVHATPVPLAPTTPPEVAELLRMRSGLSAEEVKRRQFAAARHEDVGKRALAHYLLEMEERRLYQADGHSSTQHSAEARLGMDRRRTGELIAVARRLGELPLLDAACCDGRLSWSQVMVVARMASPTYEAAWVEQACRLSLPELQRLARRSQPGGPPRTDANAKGLPEVRFPIAGKVDPLTFETFQQAQGKLSAETGREVGLMEMFAVLARELLATDADGSTPGRRPVDASIYRVEVSECCLLHRTEGPPLTVSTEVGHLPIDEQGPGRASARSEAMRCDAGVRTWHGVDHRDKDVRTPKRMRRKVLGRDGRRCRSCTSRKDLMVHHIELRSHGGRTIPQNLVTLCTTCHTLVHADLLVIRGESVSEALFLDAKGQAVNARSLAGLEALLQASQPPARAPEAAGRADPTVTLARVPRQVDAAWWRRHAHLIKDRGDRGQLRFEAGAPIEAEGLEPVVIPPAREAFADVVGQARRVSRLRHEARVAKARGQRFPHTLLTGPAGTGKTTLARGIAAVAQQPLTVVDASQAADRSALVRLLAGLEEGALLFLDEAHALPPAVQDTLLLALAEQRLALLLTDGVTARAVTVRLPAFTLVAATTDEGPLTKALVSRFKVREHLAHLEEPELVEVVQAAARQQGAEATPDAAQRIARAARGTPRAARDLFDKALGDVLLADGLLGDGLLEEEALEEDALEEEALEHAAAAVCGPRVVTREIVDAMLVRLGYDAELLDERERAYLRILRASPQPVSLAALAAGLDLPRQVVRDRIEPELRRRELIRTTPGGREALPAAGASYPRRLATAVWNDGPAADRVSDRPTLVGWGAPNIRRTRPSRRSSA